MKFKAMMLAALFGATAFVSVDRADARDRVRVVGSSTVFPYTQAVAEEFANKLGRPAPVVESTGTGGGMKIFCQGLGESLPDATGASRAMKKSEHDLCVANGVTDISEALLGYDGLSIAVSRRGQPLDVTRQQLFLALAAEVPVDGEWKANPYRRWNEIDGSLPDIPIQVFGPPPTSGTRDAFVELAMEPGCKSLPEHEALNADEARLKCSRMRQDGLFIEAGENDNLIVQRLDADPQAYGIFGYSFLYENEDKLQAVALEGVTPEFDTIADGSYPLSRPVFIYFKNAHRGVIPGFEEFIAEYMSDAALSEDGYLADRGLVPLSEEKLEEVRDEVLQARNMQRFASN